MSFDNAVVVNKHVVWGKLTAAEQAELLANYPLHPSVVPPAATVLGDAVDPRFEQWLDTAYSLRHVTDSLNEDPFQ